MAQDGIIKDLLSKATNRRGLLKKIAMAIAAVGAAGISAEAQSAAPAPAGVVQFALNLEYLEAEFYSVATTGLTISQQGTGVTGSGTAGATTTRYSGATTTRYSGNPVDFSSSSAFRVAQNIAADEINHVVLLRAALTANGVMPVAKPAINLDALLGMDRHSETNRRSSSWRASSKTSALLPTVEPRGSWWVVRTWAPQLASWR